MSSALYEPLIERDLDAIPAAVRKFRAEHSSEDLFLAVARFAILAYAPSLHSKHCVLAALSAYELREELGERWDDVLIEVARYAAESRQPWSEPPILDPPKIDADQPRDIDALRAAVASQDRLAAERWLAARVDDAADDLYSLAADNFDDLGVKFIVVDAVIKLSRILGEKGKYAALRVAVWELVNASNGHSATHPPGFLATLGMTEVVDNALAERGSIESVTAVLLYEAAKNTKEFARVCEDLSSLDLKSGASLNATASPIYRLARDYGHHLRACAIGDAKLKAATAYNLEHGASMADWSFA